MYSTMRLRPISPLQWAVWFLLPGAVLAWIVFATPHALDIALSSPFYFSDGFSLNRAPFMLFLHRVARVVPIGTAVLALVIVLRTLRARKASGGGFLDLKHLFYLLAAMLACVMLVKFLKTTTGVYCPVRVDVFGGEEPIASPTFSWFARPGHCWPSGFAGTGWCLFALYFAFRDRSALYAKRGFALALGVGLFCSVVQVIRGEHFFTHVLGTALIDWLVCASLYVLFFARDIIRAAVQEKSATAGSMTLSSFSSRKKIASGQAAAAIGAAGVTSCRSGTK
ncbi:phosphatase PAP2 family protein [Mesosutterella sp. AGMB02718]|uniref:Phosphatase PAP2 family protein n=1 Tax=Mesosutterella faecium TaxID=2925194 RepID=A0ABT7IRK8_9BURK|nr:phosphatase PAP2 family protein [Mesosutterella sp. AGMB02718]MDL2060541.1 phosphatase PAP2 family protein [Mesosutterella sp. AGMB02718]